MGVPGGEGSGSYDTDIWSRRKTRITDTEPAATNKASI